MRIKSVGRAQALLPQGFFVGLECLFKLDHVMDDGSVMQCLAELCL